MFNFSPYLRIKVFFGTLINLATAAKGSSLLNENLVSPKHLSPYIKSYLKVNYSISSSLQYRYTASALIEIYLVFSFVFIVNGLETLN